MDGGTDRDDGFTVLDGAALVVAAAVASVHMRTPVTKAVGAGWGLVWITFAGVAATAAGPILLAVRRYGRRPRGYPRLGDRLWALLGSPWILTAPLRPSRLGPEPSAPGLYGTGLTVAVGAACLVVGAVLWKAWVLKPPGAGEVRDGPVPWTEKVGMVLSVAWPLQCGFLLVVLDSEAGPSGI